MPSGWGRITDTPIDIKAYKRRAVYSGVKTSVDTAYANVKTFYGDNALSIQVTSSGASAVGEISVEYTTHIGEASGGEYPDDNAPVSPDTYQLQSVAVPTALSAHPAFAGIAGAVQAIDYAFEHGDLAALNSAASVSQAAGRYAALRVAGVTQWEGTGFIWRVTRHYSTIATPYAITAAAQAAVNVGRVYAWSSVEGHTKIDEPKYVVTGDDGQAASAASFEWRLAGVSVSRTETNLDLTWEYQGAWKWASYLYPGGSWSPALPA